MSQDSDDERRGGAGEHRSRSRDRDEQRGRNARRQVPNPFRSPKRTQPPAIDMWSGTRGGYAYTTPFAAAPTRAAEYSSCDAASVPLPDDDVDMGSDHGYGDGRMLNAPAIPLPPNVSTKAERTHVYAPVPEISGTN